MLEARSILKGAFVLVVLAGCTRTWVDDGYRPPSPKGTSSPSPGGSTTVSSTSECLDPHGFGERGCFRCTPKTNDELLRACSPSKYEDFDNVARIVGFEPGEAQPKLPPASVTLPMYDGGAGTPEPEPPPAPPCQLSSYPNPVMVLGATGFPMETLAKAMGVHATIFYSEKGSCDGVAAMITNEPKLQGEVVTFDTTGSKTRCVLSQPHPADIAISSLFAGTCSGQSGLAGAVELPPEVQDFLGPVNPVMFAVPATSKQRAISAEAAYMVFGFGDLSGVNPWTEEQYVFRRRPSSGNQQIVALSIGIPPDRLRGRDSNGSTNMLKALLSSDDPEATIGISSAEIVDTNRDAMRALAYKHYKQPVAFYPDADPGSLDRRNVRDGHYFMWLSLHVLARTRSGDPVGAPNAILDTGPAVKVARDAAIKRLVFVMTSRQPAPVASVDLFGAFKRTGNVPQCAMRVKRAKDGAGLEPFTPSVSCACAFEAALPSSAPAGNACYPCESSSDCVGVKSTCSFGYCE